MRVSAHAGPVTVRLRSVGEGAIGKLFDVTRTVEVKVGEVSDVVFEIDD